MTPFLEYMVKVGAALILFYGFYELFLKKETYFHLNRIYLVSALFLSFLLPAVPLASPFRTLPVTTDFGAALSSLPAVRSVAPANLLPVIYAAGAIVLLVRFLNHLVRLARVIRRNGVRRAGSVRVVAVERDFSPFSFFGLVFINLNDRRVAESDLRRILAHEQVHVRQGHSFDVLLMELVIILQWFNPFVWPYKKALRETHEYLADFGVLAQGFNSVKYRRLVFEQHVGAALFEFGNNFKQSQIKRRIAMMSKRQSGKAARLKLLLALPLVLFLVLAFAEPKAAASAAPAAPVLTGQTESPSKAKVEQTAAEIRNLEQVLKVLTQKIETATDENLKKDWTTARMETEKKLQTLREDRDRWMDAREKSEIREASAESRRSRQKEEVLRDELAKVRNDEARIEYKKQMAEIQRRRQASLASQTVRAEEAAAEYKRILEKSQDTAARDETRNALAEIRERQEQARVELERSKTRDLTAVSEATAKYMNLREKEAVIQEQMDKNRDAANKDEYLTRLKTDQERQNQMLTVIQERQASRAARADEATAAYKERLEKKEIRKAEALDEFRKVRENDLDTPSGIKAAGLKKIIADLTEEELAVRSKMARTEDEKLRLELKAQLAGILNKIEAAKAEYLKLKSEKV